MGDSLITVIAIFLAAVLMFVFPLVTVSDRNDDIAQLTVQSDTTAFVDEVRFTGKMSEANYGKFVQKLGATGNSYDVEIEWKVKDENAGKKSAQANSEKIGENYYYSKFTSQIMEEFEKNNGSIILKEGDIISVKVKNTNQTIAQSLKNFFYGITGNDTAQIEARHSGVVTTTGTNRK